MPRHMIVTPAHALTEADRADLEAEGLVIERPLSGGRFTARVDEEIFTGDTRLSSIRPFAVADKVHASAWRNAASAAPFIRVRVFFHDDVPFDDARSAITDAGGAVRDPLATRYEPLSSTTAVVPPSALAHLAADDRVLVVYGARKYRASASNQIAAMLSHVTELQTAPYNLDGSGVVLTYFELAPPDTTHPEFGGRVTADIACPSTDTNCKDSGNIMHATHVAGTMVAAGVNPQAKGMAPAATLHSFLANIDPWLDQKQTSLKALGSVADNNSWGYVLGWECEPASTCAGWTWEEGDELIGGYSGDINAVLDHVALTNGSLMVHAAGNDADNTGPTEAPYKHFHVDNNGKKQPQVYCYSQNGSGTDCPVTQGCTSGTQYCETVRHPTHAATASNPGGSIGWTASSKNIIAVGATNGGSPPQIASFSSRGPTKDGRIKPELSAKGAPNYSTEAGNTYGNLYGTSMATPVVTGSMALLVQQWRKTNGGASPLPVVLKALAIAGAQDIGNPGPDYTYGFGFLNTKAAVDLILADAATGKRVAVANATQGSVADYPVTVASSQNLRAVISWFDPEVLPLGSEELASKTLVNDLDVKIVDPSGNTVLPWVLDPNSPAANATRGVNTRDNTEEVDVANAASGTYHVIVTGTTVPTAPQQYALVVNADIGAVAACDDVLEPNDTPGAATGPLLSGRAVTSRICNASDVDYFTFTTNAAGTVSVVVTAGDTPLRASLYEASKAGPDLPVVQIAPGTSQTLSVTVLSGTRQLLLGIAPNGQVGSNGTYSITPTFPFTPASRRRGVGR